MKRENKSLLRMLRKYFRRHLNLFIIDIFCAIAVAAVDLAFPIVSRYAMRTMLPDQQFQAFFALMAIVACAYVGRSACQYVMTYWGHTFGTYVETDLRNDLFCHLQTLDFDFYDKNRS